MVWLVPFKGILQQNEDDSWDGFCPAYPSNCPGTMNSAGTLSLPYGGRNTLRVKSERSVDDFCSFIEESLSDGLMLGLISEHTGISLLHCVVIYVLL